MLARVECAMFQSCRYPVMGSGICECQVFFWELLSLNCLLNLLSPHPHDVFTQTHKIRMEVSPAMPEAWSASQNFSCYWLEWNAAFSDYSFSMSGCLVLQSMPPCAAFGKFKDADRQVAGSWSIWTIPGETDLWASGVERYGTFQTSSTAFSLEDKIHLGSEFSFAEERRQQSGEKEKKFFGTVHYYPVELHQAWQYSDKQGWYSKTLDTYIDAARSLETYITLEVLRGDWC